MEALESAQLSSSTRRRRRALERTLAVAGSFWFLACSGGRVAEGPNLILISIDSLRADHLGAYGYERPTSPRIDRLAQEGVLFEVASSSTSWTLPSHASMFTGLPDSVHGCDRGNSSLAPARRTLAEALREAGYQTAGFWSGPYLHPHFGLDQGFDDYVNCTSYEIGSEVELKAGKQREGEEQRGRAFELAHEDVTSPKIVAEVEDWLRGREDRPFFLFIHMWDVHYNYVPPAPYDRMFDADYEGPLGENHEEIALLKKRDIPERDLEHLIALYDGEIAWTDHHVGMLVDLLEELEISDDTAVFVTADHGEEFFEHGRFGHRKTLFEESVRVPLILRYPGLRMQARLDDPVRTVDIAPTLLELAGAQALPSTMGRSLLPLLRQEQDAGGEPVVCQLARGGKTLFSLRMQDWKMIVQRESGRPVGLWDLARDPGERENLLQTDSELRARAKRTLREVLGYVEELEQYHRLDGPQSSRRIPPDLEKHLTGMGYAGNEDEDDEKEDDEP